MAHGVGTVYVPRSPATGVLYAVVRSHLTEFLAAVNAETDVAATRILRRFRR